MHRLSSAAVLFVLMMGILLWASANSALGQASIPVAVMNAQSITPAQTQTIRTAVDEAVQQMANGSDEQVAEARGRLLSFYRDADAVNGTPPFYDVLSSQIASRLQSPLQTDRVICRLNAMLVSSRVLVPQVTDLVMSGLQDSSPAVRYAAARAIISLAELNDGQGRNPQVTQPVLNGQNFNRWLDGLTQMLENETSQPVIRMAALAMAKLPVPAAREQAIEILQDRVAFHRENPGATMAGDREALKAIYLYEAQHGTFNNAQQMARVALNYMAICAAQLHGNQISASAERERNDMLEVCQAVLSYLADPQSGVSVLSDAQFKTTRDNLNNAIKRQQWVETELYVRTLLAELPPASE